VANIPGTIETGQLIERIQTRVYEGLDAAVDHTIHVGEGHAKRLAPVRKISYSEGRAKKRQLARAEVASLPTGRSLSRPVTFSTQQRGRPLFTSTRRSKQILEAPEVEEDESGFWRLKDRDSQSFLDWRGRAELKELGRTTHATPVGVNLATGKIITRRPTSAIFSQGGKSTLGGRLRGEIRGFLEPVKGGIVTGWLNSPTPYARFVEFPTSRTAEQPYMRPTLKFLKPIFVKAVYRELKKRGFNPMPR
jgi:hypothetical protein